MTPLTTNLCSRGWLSSGIFCNLLRTSLSGSSLGNSFLQRTKVAIHIFSLSETGNLKSNLASIRWRSWLSRNQNRIALQHQSSGKNDRDGLHNIYIPGSINGSTRAKIRRTRERIRRTRHEMSKRIEGMKENVMTIPNGLCVLRIALTPFLSYVVVCGNFEIAVGLFAFAGITDLLDGYIARNVPNQKSVCGSFLDPIADKCLVAMSFLTLTFVGLIPTPLTALIILRDAILVGAGFYIRYQSLLPPRTLTKYFDVTLATASVSPSLLSKINTGMQLTLIATTLAAPVFHFVDHPYLHTLWYVTACSTVASGLGYLFTKDNYTILSRRRR